MKEEPDKTLNQICPSCGKRVVRNRQAGTITSYLFRALDCSCNNAGGEQASFFSVDNGDEFCPKCGLRIVKNSKNGSLTAFLFQSTRCKCPADPLFAEGAMSDKFWRLKESETGNIFVEVGGEHVASLSRSINLAEGATIGGAYKVIEFIGGGGMGEVYLVRHENLGRKCALKVIPPQLVTELGWQRFQLEARAVAKLNHVNLVRVTDLGIHEGCLPFYAMDYVVGDNLAELLHKHGPMPLNVMIEIFMQVCDGIECAHHNGILHRDLKPANIMTSTTLSGAKQAKILDFGLAKLTGHNREKQSLTLAGDIFGSPFYMSPEQCLGEKLDNRSDIYSLGCTMFECLTGSPPFSGNSTEVVIFGHLQGDPPSLESVAGANKFPPAMEVVVAKLLRKNPAERYQTLSQLKADLELVAAGREVQPVYASRDKKNVSIKPQESQARLRAEINQTYPVPILAPIKILLFVPIAVLIAALAFAGYQTYCHRAPEYFSHRTSSGGKIFVLPQESEEKSAWRSNYSDYQPIAGPIQIGADNELYFKPGRMFAERPELFDRFRPDDIDGISLSRIFWWKTEHFARIAKLTSLKDISLSGNSLKPTDLKYFEHLPKLKYLAVSGTRLKGQDLANFGALNQIAYMSCDELDDLSPMLDKLQGSKAMVFLSIKSNGLTDDDAKRIGAIKHLAVLNLQNNAITAEGLKYLVGLPLIELTVTGLPLGPESIDVLHKYRQLKKLHIDTKKWSKEDKERLFGKRHSVTDEKTKD